MASKKAVIPTGSVDVEITGDTRAVESILRDFEHAMAPDQLEDFMKTDVYFLIRERHRNRFEQEGDDVSGPWAELRPFTQEQRRRGGFGATGPINVRHGSLRDHVLNRPPATNRHTLGATLWFPAPGGSKDNLDKVRVAQQGLDKPKTPARPVIGVSPVDVELVLLATSRYLGRSVRGGRMIFP